MYTTTQANAYMHALIKMLNIRTRTNSLPEQNSERKSPEASAAWMAVLACSTAACQSGECPQAWCSRFVEMGWFAQQASTEAAEVLLAVEVVLRHLC